MEVSVTETDRIRNLCVDKLSEESETYQYQRIMSSQNEIDREIQKISPVELIPNDDEINLKLKLCFKEFNLETILNGLKEDVENLVNNIKLKNVSVPHSNPANPSLPAEAHIDGIPPGNEIVNLVEVRNGPLSAPQPPATQNTDTQADCLTGIYRMERFTKNKLAIINHTWI